MYSFYIVHVCLLVCVFLEHPAGAFFNANNFLVASLNLWDVDDFGQKSQLLFSLLCRLSSQTLWLSFSSFYRHDPEISEWLETHSGERKMNKKNLFSPKQFPHLTLWTLLGTLSTFSTEELILLFLNLSESILWWWRWDQQFFSPSRLSDLPALSVAPTRRL